MTCLSLLPGQHSAVSVNTEPAVRGYGRHDTHFGAQASHSGNRQQAYEQTANQEEGEDVAFIVGLA